MIHWVLMCMCRMRGRIPRARRLRSLHLGRRSVTTATPGWSASPSRRSSASTPTATTSGVEIRWRGDIVVALLGRQRAAAATAPSAATAIHIWVNSSVSPVRHATRLRIRATSTTDPTIDSAPPTPS
jgi:hypothetical protein